MNKTDILIIGGGPAGIVTAITARKHNPDKKITLVRKEQKSVVPCGIPYIFHRLDSVDKNITPDDPLTKNKIDLIIDEAKKIDPKIKKVSLAKKGEIEYEKLVLATGSSSTKIPIKGIEKEGVWLVKKEVDYLKKMREAVMEAKKIVIIGGGFIGVEMAEEISSLEGKEINIVEKMDTCLMANFDKEFALEAQKKLEEKGVKIHTGRMIEEIAGNDKVEKVILDDKKEIETDLVILSIGAKANIELAKEAGIRIEENGNILVDEYMRTNYDDVFAVGDCAQTKDFFTSKSILVMLASTACSEARIAGASLYQLEIFRENKGTLGAFSTYLKDSMFGGVGFSEETARNEGFETIVGESEAPDHHPGTLPHTRKIKVKLIFSKDSGNLLGGQVIGGKSAGELVNVISLAIQRRATLYDFDSLQISTHPLLTSAPTVYPLITAAQSALGKIM